MTGDKLYELFSLLYNKELSDLFSEFKLEIRKQLPDSIIKLLPVSYNNNDLLEELYQAEFKKINVNNRMVLLDSFANLDLKVGLGAATSTSAQTPSQKLQLWGLEATSKAQGLAKRVLGYGHESIAEQARTTFGMMCSMVTYHQQIRHRLSENHREKLESLILDSDRDVCLPPTIKESIFKEDFLSLVRQFKKFRIYLYKKYNLDKILPFLLNCDQIKLIIATNARIDIEMLAERICRNAQWEIRELSTKKLKQLRELSNILYEKALPSCVYGKCKEGKLTCGKQQQMRKEWRS
ncbi:alternative thymidylate synthase [Halobacteroides halobius DSM 5150]|uniref:Alternative thymidylate synthase n=1 Tax=Halobacteroides halobius (strain ATCC 35273 / DSM 5150 / MD-1) TaxID=748449 RepID=L0K4I6_HALHC|nr:FAD-dependent thymidylate synthase [Halobacteroides halobius]AGB40182.1 alternative thymidylate synthase [Halobacteroides halobius DSM 5150]